jgi:hypothetical protein
MGLFWPPWGMLQTIVKKSPSKYISINYPMWKVLKTALGWLFHAST